MGGGARRRDWDVPGVVLLISNHNHPFFPIILPSMNHKYVIMLNTVHFSLLYPSSPTLSPCRQMLRELVPLDVLKSDVPEDWKKAIVTQINRHPIRSKEEAKICFLKYICHWQTFGSAFFEVKVRTLNYTQL